MIMRCIVVPFSAQLPASSALGLSHCRRVGEWYTATVRGFATARGKSESQLRLELVQVLFRHGERTPLHKEMYPNDIYDETAYEPWGLGQLTNQGKMREYGIGKMLRERYNDFLGDVYQPRDVYALSTDIDRTKMSLQLVLAGLYPPASVQNWNSKLPWLAIPTHYVPEKVDILMRPHSCPVYEEAVEQVKKQKEVKDKINAHKDFYKYLSEKTGLTIDEPTPVYEVYNLLSSQKHMNFTLPDWCTDEIFKKMQDIVALEYEIRSYTTYLKRINGGMLVKKFVENLNVDGKRVNPRKIYLYSGHEVNLAAYTRAHNINEITLPPYGGAIIFEKLRDAGGKLFVRMLFWTGATEQLKTFNLGDCGEVCPIDKYLKLVKNVTPSREEENCYWDRITREELEQLYVEKIYLN